MCSDRKKRVRPTIQAIADAAGVSRATVSLILTNREEIVSRFRQETVAKVRAIAEEMGYAANLMAISLRSSHPSFFGLILRGPGTTDAMGWHHRAFEGQLMSGVMDAAALLKLYPVLTTQDSPGEDMTFQRVRGVLDGGVFGAIIRTPLPVLEEPIHRQIEQGLPVVIVFPEHPTVCPSNAIDVDNKAVGQLAAHLLHEAGRQKWVVVCDDFMYEPIQLRQNGALGIATEVRARAEVLMIPQDVGESNIVQWLAPKLKDIRPDAIYAVSSLAGVGALLACQEAGLRVPEDTVLVGCDASLWQTPGSAQITSVDVSWHSAGELAVQKMASLGQQGEAVFDNIRLPPEVCPGGTCPVPDFYTSQSKP